MGRRLYYYGALALFLVYTAWILGPYLRSVIVRDASITTWARNAVAPINGRIVGELPHVGDVVGPEGTVATIRNNLLLQETRVVEDTRDKVIESEARIREANEFLAELEALNHARLEARYLSSEVFQEQLETMITNLQTELELNRERIEVLQRIANRQKSLVDSGSGSVANLDEALLRVANMRQRQAELEAQLSFARVRARSARNGVFINEDGGTPEWVRHGELELQLAQRRARHEMHAAEATLEEASKDLAIEERKLSDLGESKVAVPPGSTIFSVISAPDATVSAGDTILEWINCTDLMVDVPVSDAELPLIRRGAAAEVVLEGEPDVRIGTVQMTRGSTATLGRNDLAAVAKGRSEGVAQVLLKLEAHPDEFGRCPVGRAAYVEFPDVGLIDVLRARLRL